MAKLKDDPRVAKLVADATTKAHKTLHKHLKQAAKELPEPAEPVGRRAHRAAVKGVLDAAKAFVTGAGGVSEAEE